MYISVASSYFRAWPKRERFGKIDYAHFANLSYQISDIHQFHLFEVFVRCQLTVVLSEKKIF